MAKTSAACKGCGADIQRTGKTAPIRWYCTDACKPRCIVQGCPHPYCSRLGYCTAHQNYLRKTGKTPAPTERHRNVGPCSIEGCERPSRQRGWCTDHYSRWRSYGDPNIQPGYRWSPKGLDCAVCGRPVPEDGGRRGYCSVTCVVYASKGRLKGVDRSPSRPCPGCSRQITIIPTGGPTRQRIKRSDVGLCDRCRQDNRKHGLSVQFLADRDGPICGLCGLPVDLTLTAPDRMRPSVDHIYPRAKGGTNEPSNLQLAHLKCNALKAAKVA